MKNRLIGDFQARVRKELVEHILPFWMERTIDLEHGGFIGRMSNALVAEQDAPKGLILNARILWTFSAAYRFAGDKRYLDIAQRAYEYLSQHFLDPEYGGAFWLLDSQGQPLDAKKKIYGQAFVIYALAEYYSAIQDAVALQKALGIFQLVEEKGYDHEYQGYFEAFERNWKLADDLRLSVIDMNEKKSMNAHLHILEGYTNLYRIWKDERLRQKLAELIQVFLNRIINLKTNHFCLFFDEKWQSKVDRISFGHDIEGSWLLCEAAEVLGDEEVIRKIQEVAVLMAHTVYTEGLEADGGLCYEADAHGITNFDRHWWPQAEAVVGFLNAHQLTKEKHFLEASYRCWQFIEKYIIDHKMGEWFWKVSREGTPDLKEAKVSEWKGPYHNGRACMEVLRRLEKMNVKPRKFNR